MAALTDPGRSRERRRAQPRRHDLAYGGRGRRLAGGDGGDRLYGGSDSDQVRGGYGTTGRPATRGPDSSPATTATTRSSAAGGRPSLRRARTTSSTRSLRQRRRPPQCGPEHDKAWIPAGRPRTQVVACEGDLHRGDAVTLIRRRGENTGRRHGGRTASPVRVGVPRVRPLGVLRQPAETPMRRGARRPPGTSHRLPDGHQLAWEPADGHMVSPDGEVLIIEDDDVIARGMARHLETAGFDAVGVANGETGLAAFGTSGRTSASSTSCSRHRRLARDRAGAGRGHRHADRRRLGSRDGARPRTRARDRRRRLPRQAVLDEGARCSRSRAARRVA